MSESQWNFSGSNFYEKDGDRSHQAAITTDYVALPIPSYISATSSEEVYPAVPAQAPSALLRGDIAIVDVDNQLMITSSGPSMSGCFASFGNREKPRLGYEDEFCKKFRPVGVIKNTETDPQGAMFGPNGGIPRINSTQVAVQVAGATTLKYNHPNKPVVIGDLVIYYPPDQNKQHYKRDERPVPIIGPLHWSLLLDSIKNVCVSMIHFQRSRNLQLPNPDDRAEEHIASGGMWRNVAAERKRSILVHIMGALFILVKRGYVMILTSKISKQIALRDRLIHKIKLLVAEAAANSSKNITPDVTILVKEYDNAISGKDGLDSSDIKGSQDAYRYNPMYKRSGLGSMNQIERVDRENANYLETFLSTSGKNTQQHTMYADTLQQDSLTWMIEGLGLAGGETGSGSGYGREPWNNTTTDILRLLSWGATGDDVAPYYMKSRAAMLGVGENSSSLSAFQSHLRNYLGGEEIAHMELRDAFTSRGVGYSLSAAAGLGPSIVNSSMVPTIDVVLGGRRW